jgi:5S rRNA maturation endonuclease (ribonuclease M5)
MRQIFDEIKQRVKLGDYLSFHYGLDLKNGMALCPLHQDEKTRSFHVINDERWYCFGGCGGGDIFEFVQKKHNVPLMDAVRMVAKEVGVEMSKEEEGRIRAFKDLQDRNRHMLEKAAKELHEDLNADTYLASRHITPEAIKHFGLGYRPDCNAISIPIYDRFNRLVGYSLRLMTPGPNEPKYKNSRADDLGLFQKKEILYNLGACRADVKKRVYICEGYFDVIALWMAGFKNVVGVCQAIMTKEQMKILHEAMTPETEVILVPDTDKPGIEALHKNVSMFRAYSKERSIKTVMVSEVDDSKDAGEAFVKNPGKFVDVVNAPEQAELSMLRLISETELDRAKQYQLARPVLASVSPLLRDDLVVYLAETWGKDKKLLGSYFGTEVNDADPSSFSGSLDLCDQYGDYIKHVHAHGIRFNIPGLDRLIRRIAPGEVCYIQARTAVGKTAALLNFLGGFSKQKIPCLFFSLEQQKEQIYERMMQIANRLPGHEIERMTLDRDGRLSDFQSNYYEMFRNVWVCDKPGLTLAGIKEHILQFAAINTFPAVVAIDYFGYINIGDKDIYAGYSKLAKDIKSTAKELNNSWVVLNQLSRVGGSGGEPVTLDMGRDTGVIEESADVLIGLWRPELEKDITDEERLKRQGESKMVGAVLKNRAGPTGQIIFRFDRRTLVVSEYDQYHQQASSYQPTPEPVATQEEMLMS